MKLTGASELFQLSRLQQRGQVWSGGASFAATS